MYLSILIFKTVPIFKFVSLCFNNFITNKYTFIKTYFSNIEDLLPREAELFQENAKFIADVILHK